MSEVQNSTDLFKVPCFELKNDEVATKEENVKLKTDNTIKKKDTKATNVPLPYKEPEWSGLPPFNYNLEIIKNGTIVSTLPIKKSLIVFGRLELCDVVFEHPSVSRYHAVIQYCKGDDSHPKGFYLYDLGSTHGTFLNKLRITSKVYYKLKVGYMLKCGGSTRLHIFQGPEEEEEEKVETKSVDDKLKEEEGCNWGMDDDAEENEEDRGINPFALSVNEDLDLDDPKKTLRSWFEREGFEVEYNVEEKAFRTFSCSVQLPVDTPSGDFLKVETTVTGKKKEAMVACALEACRTLDHMGLLRQSHQESRQRKKKKWEENDYYDSDEDTFYDRTGEIEKRREMRKRLVKRGKVENFQSLENKLNILVSEIEEINKKLMPYNIKGLQSVTDNSEDSLESYMSSLSQSMNVSMDKFEKRKLKLRLTEAEKEKVHLEKMLNVARPAKLPSIVKHPGIIGKRLKSKLQLPLKKPKAESQVNREEIIEEVESSSENETTEKHQSEAEAQINQIKETDSYVESKRYGLLLNVKNETEKMEENKILPKDTVSLNSDVSSSLSNTVDKNKESNDEKMDFEVSSTTEKKNYSKKAKKGVDVYEKDNDYCTWTPPVNQSGDGMTHLNAKYGY